MRALVVTHDDKTNGDGDNQVDGNDKTCFVFLRTCVLPVGKMDTSSSTGQIRLFFINLSSSLNYKLEPQ